MKSFEKPFAFNLAQFFLEVEHKWYGSIFNMSLYYDEAWNLVNTVMIYKGQQNEVKKKKFKYDTWILLGFVSLIAIITDCIVSKAEDQYPKNLQYTTKLKMPINKTIYFMTEMEHYNNLLWMPE